MGKEAQMADTKIVVTAKQRATAFCPVSVDLPAGLDEVAGKVLFDEQRGAAVPCQAESSGEGSRLLWILDSAAPGQERTFTLTDGEPPAAGPGVEIADSGDVVQVKVGGELLTNYHYQNITRPVLYPVIGPFGHGVTRDFPMQDLPDDHKDHPHHRSVWVAWGDVNGSDNWSETEGHGTLAHRSFEVKQGGPVAGIIATRNDWLDNAGKKLMEDRLVYRFYNLPGSMRLIEMDITFTATEGDVRFGDTKEGGICSVRVQAPIEAARGGKIENSLGGVNEDETWGKRASWCDYSGVVAEHKVGIAIFDRPGNFRYPTYWHVRNYGLMTANPFGLSHFLADESADGSHTLAAGDTLAFRYALFVHAGDATEGGVRSRYLDWVYPPVAAVAE